MKKKKKKKGFTLIEAMAMLIIIAVVSLIAVPIVNNIIKESKKEAFSVNAKLILKQALNEKVRDYTFDLSQVNPENMFELLAVAGSDYESVQLKEVNDKIFINIMGTKKWEGFSACGSYENLTVVEGKCELDNEPPTITFIPDGSTTYIKSSHVQIGVEDQFLDEDSLRYVWNNSDETPSEEEYINTFKLSDYIIMPSDSGTFYLHVIAKDKLNNVAQEYRQFLLDNEAPIINIIGDLSVTIDRGSVYIDLGATAIDNIDSDVELILIGEVNPEIIGTYMITYIARDDAGNEATATRTINVIDVEAPIITLNGDNPTNIFVDSVYNDLGAIAIDDGDGNVTDKIVKTGSVNTSIPGQYEIVYTVSDSVGNVATLTRIVNVIDNVAPIVKFEPDKNNEYKKSHNTKVTITDKHSDVDAGNLKYLWTNNTNTPSEDIIDNIFTNGSTIGTTANITGTYYLWVLAKDTAGNITIVRSKEFRLDNTKPIITLKGESVVNINAGTKYNDAGANASDEHSGISGSISVTGEVDTSKAGTYTITYTVSDRAGNQANPVKRTVNVIDNVGPIVKFGTDGNSTYQKNHSTTVTVSDEHSSVNKSSLKYLWNTSTSTPNESDIKTSFNNGGTISTPSGKTGTYYLWILAKDIAGNKTIARSKNFKLDNTKPTISLNGSASESLSLGSSYSDPGATASDNIDGNLTSKITKSGSVNGNKSGTYTITYTVSDNAGNSASVSRQVTVNTVTLYRYRNLKKSCDTCYDTCYRYKDGTPTYSCTSGYLDGTKCVTTETVTSRITEKWHCSPSGSWQYVSQVECSGNCNKPCSDGSSPRDTYISSDNCPPSKKCTSAIAGTKDTCTITWKGFCYKRTAAKVTYKCPSGYTGGGSSSTCKQSYDCDPHDCNCDEYWGSWSSWSTTKRTASSTRQVQTKTCTVWPCT